MAQAVIPMLAYENGPASMDWLARAFGFKELDRRVENGNLTHGEMELDARDAEGCYGERLLPLKLAMDVLYVRRASLAFDLTLIVRTAWMLGTALLGRREFPLPPELEGARRIMNERGAARMTA